MDDEPKELTVLETLPDDPADRLVWAESADQAPPICGDVAAGIHAAAEGIGFLHTFFLPHETPNTAEQVRNTALNALEPVFGGGRNLLGVGNPADKRFPLAPSAGCPWPSGSVHRSGNRRDAADLNGPARRVA